MKPNDGSKTLPERFGDHEKECRARYDRIWPRLNHLTRLSYIMMGAIALLNVLVLVAAPIVAAILVM